MKQPVEGYPNLYKDPETGVISNRSDTERSRYQIARNQARMNQNNSIELETLRNDIDDIKSLLQQLLNK